MAVKVAIDAGHGGSDYGAVYNGRKEKDDTLKLALAVGKILEDNGIDVFYVRTTDEYETPLKKATDANNSGADYFVSIHRNAAEYPGQYNGVETLVYNNSGIRSTLAKNINSELEKVGFKNIGITTRPNLVVLKRTNMPAVLVEAGFIDDTGDNALFDEKFNQMAQAIANGIISTVAPQTSTSPSAAATPVSKSTESSVVPTVTDNMSDNDPGTDSDNSKLYRVQVGAYRNKDNAERMLSSLQMEGFPAFMIYEDGYYKVQVGAFEILANAIKMERRLRRFRYSTYIVYS
ncbi:MAG: N-acetylmuramoyl-L-alanine amidase [Lachnospira sp.]